MADNFWSQFKKVGPDSSSSSVTGSGDFWGQFKKVESKQKDVQTPPAEMSVQKNNISYPNEDQWANAPEGIRIARQRDQERQDALPEDASIVDRFKSYAGLPVTDEDYDRVKTRAYAASQVPTLGFGDELYGLYMAGPESVLGGANFSEAYKRSRDEAREFEKRAKQNNPDDYNLGTAIGAVGTTAATVPASLPAALAGIGGSTALGALSGYGSSEADTLGGQAIDTAIGAGLGAAGGVAGRAIGEGLGFAGSGVRNLVNRVRNGRDPLSTEEGLRTAIDAVKARSNEAYQRADQAGVIFKPEFTQNLYSSIQKELAESGYSPNLQGRINGVLNEIKQAGDRNISLKGVDNIRKIASSVSMDGDASERRLAGKIIEIIDRRVGEAPSNQVLSGDTQLAANAIKEARRDWKTQAKLSQVADLMDKAERRAASAGSGGNSQNALRQNLNRILNSKEGRGWTKDEKEAIRNVVFGTDAQNRLRLLGKLSPETGALGVSGLAAGGAASQLTGNPLFVLPSAIGYGAKKASEGIADRNALNVLRTILNNGNSVNQGLIPSEVSNRLLDYLQRSGALGLSSQSNNL